MRRPTKFVWITALVLLALGVALALSEHRGVLALIFTIGWVWLLVVPILVVDYRKTSEDCRRNT